MKGRTAVLIEDALPFRLAANLIGCLYEIVR